jgi:signal transduction histidine kinase
MGAAQKFKISSALKDIIGRDLITNDFVAIFELVKNSFDAHANKVEIEFDEDSIMIIDDGKGMGRADIIEKWLFVAYSAKKTGEEDSRLPKDYRNQISQRRGYAGSKGIGRFSCDRLGRTLDLYTRPVGGKRVEHLSVNWRTFEQDPRKEFATVDVNLTREGRFPVAERAQIPAGHGTVLLISDLRDLWDYSKIERLRSYLAKLVDPFQSAGGLQIVTHVADEHWPGVEGPVGNNVIDLLNDKTARIEVSISQGRITSTLHDRGALIYKIEEPSPYKHLDKAEIAANLYYLNRSAKHTFTSRMGVQPVSFGNVFLFVNGFRIFPVGEETNDTWGIARRKQQGTARYFGLRDILGKIEVRAPAGMFVEASSRDAGLIMNAPATQLIEAVTKQVVQRLERYVVTVNWPDKLDQDRDDTSGLTSDSARVRMIRVVRGLAGSSKIKLLEYNSELIDIVNERSAEFEESMAGLAVVAEEMGDETLLAKIERSRQRYEDLKRAEAEANERAAAEAEARRDAERRAQAAELRADQAVARVERLESQNRLLYNLQGRENEELTLLHHQVIIYATEIRGLVDRSLRKLSDPSPQLDGVAGNLEQISFQISRILGVTRFATQAGFKLNADNLKADIIQFFREYVEEVAATFGEVGRTTFVSNELSAVMTFKPIDISIVIDNLFSNASKAHATEISFSCRRGATGAGALEIVVADNGRGIDPRRVDPTKIFEKSYSGSRRGSGLGLYHVRQVLEALGGTIGLDPERRGNEARFIIKLPGGERGA